MPITIAGSSNPVFLIIRKKAALKYYLYFTIRSKIAFLITYMYCASIHDLYLWMKSKESNKI